MAKFCHSILTMILVGYILFPLQLKANQGNVMDVLCTSGYNEPNEPKVKNYKFNNYEKDSPYQDSCSNAPSYADCLRKLQLKK